MARENEKTKAGERQTRGGSNANARLAVSRAFTRAIRFFIRRKRGCACRRGEEAGGKNGLVEPLRRVALRGALDFNSLTKLPKTRGFLSFRLDLIPGAATIFIRLGALDSRRSRTVSKTQLDRAASPATPKKLDSWLKLAGFYVLGDTPFLSPFDTESWTVNC